MNLLIPLCLTLLVSLPFGIIITWGGWRMMHGRSHGLAVTASILALFPCQPLFVLGMVFGIWSLIVLNRPHIKDVFKRKSVERRSDSQKETVSRKDAPPIEAASAPRSANVKHQED